MLTFILLILMLVGYSACSPRPGDSGDYAAWGQTIGTIGAILAAIGLAVFEINNQRGEKAADQRKEDIILARSAATACALLIDPLRQADELSIAGGWFLLKAESLHLQVEGAVGALNALPLGRMVSPNAATAVLRLIAIAHELRVSLQFTEQQVSRGALILPHAFSDTHQTVLAISKQLQAEHVAAGLID